MSAVSGKLPWHLREPDPAPCIACDRPVGECECIDRLADAEPWKRTVLRLLGILPKGDQ